MANIKITELTNLTDPSTTDVMPVVDVDADVTKKVSVGEVVGKISGDVDVATNGTSSIAAGVIVNADVSASAEIAVSKLADGTARQLLQTDAAGTGVEWTSNVDVPGTLDVTGATTLDSTLGVTGQSTLASAAVSDLTEDRIVIAGASGEIEDSANLTFDGSELGVTGTLDVSSDATVGGDLTVTGDLTVEGTTTTLETQTVTVEDKNIELGVVDAPSDTTADGGGITLKGATDKTINWIDATDAWTFSEHIDIASAKEFRIAGTKVLDATSLGSAVVSSSLTSVGTIATGTWQGTAIDATYLDPTVVTTSDTGTVTSTMILDGTIVNGDVNVSAAIAGTKIDPDFGSQTVETTGDLAINTDVLFVDSSESAVGIGTTSPAVACDVVGQVRASTGILFGSDTAAANALDDYEEGNWNPGNLDADLSVAVARYIKIGRLVHAWFVTINASTAATYDLPNSVTGLPYVRTMSNPYANYGLLAGTVSVINTIAYTGSQIVWNGVVVGKFNDSDGCSIRWKNDTTESAQNLRPQIVNAPAGGIYFDFHVVYEALS